ncbi:MAG TPA: hypothetical protein VMF89_23605 [Polyangiales bacterium]|nr:hypothetical protein [Polyangiales bacterium]
MAIPSKSIPPVATSWHEPALPAFSALCDEAARRCSTQHGLPVTLSDEVRLRAWQLCWLAVDAASAPANNLPSIADTMGWPPELVGQLAALPKLNTQAWQELRRARDQKLFDELPPQESAATEPMSNEALAKMLADGFAQLDLVRLRARFTPSVTAAMTRWLSACLLALEAQAWSDDDTEASALALAVFVQSRLPGPVAVVEDVVESEPEQPVAVVEAPAPMAAEVPLPAAAPVAAAPAASEIIAEPASTIEQARGPMVHHAPRVSGPPRLAKRPAAVAQLAAAVAVAAVLLWMLTRGSTPQPEAAQPMNEVKPRVAEPAPTAHIVTPKPLAVEPAPSAPAAKPAPTPQRSAKQATGTASSRPRYRNLAAAKRAHTSKKIDDAAYAAAVAELEALRNTRIAKEQTALRNGKLSQAEYQRKVDAINKTLGFDRH